MTKNIFLKCETLPAKLSPEQLKHIHGICHQYIYHDTTRQTLAVTGLSWLLETWDKLLEATTPASWATLVAASSGGNRKLSQFSVICEIHYYKELMVQQFVQRNGSKCTLYLEKPDIEIWNFKYHHVFSFSSYFLPFSNAHLYGNSIISQNDTICTYISQEERQLKKTFYNSQGTPKS